MNVPPMICGDRDPIDPSRVCLKDVNHAGEHEDPHWNVRWPRG